MDNLSKNTDKTGHKLLFIEELEERIAPVTVTSEPTSWVLGSMLNAYGPDENDNDEYWIFYLGPGEATILGSVVEVAGDTFNVLTVTAPELNGHHIGNITITGSTMESALFILDYPQDPTPEQASVFGILAAGSLLAFGTIEVRDGDLGYLAIDGTYMGLLGGRPQDGLYVAGNLGKFDVGCLVGDVYAEGDIYEIDIDSTLGVFYQPPGASGVEHWGDWGTFWPGTLIRANGNIGAIRVGVGLSDSGAEPGSTDILGGLVAGHTYIYANADGVGAPGVIDLIEVLAGSQNYGNGVPGSLGAPFSEYLPTISAGPAGNVRFLHIDGDAYFVGPGNVSTTIQTIVVTLDSPAVERTIVDDSGGVLVINPQEVTFRLPDGTQTIPVASVVEYLIVPVDRETQGPGAMIARIVAHGSTTLNVSGEVEIGYFGLGNGMEYAGGTALDNQMLLDRFEGLVTDLAQLDPSAYPELFKNLQGPAHETVTGPGECDIYFLDATSGVADHSVFAEAPDGEIPIFLNNTRDGDIANIAVDGDTIYLSASARGGDIGITESITPYPLKGPIYWQDGDIAWVDVAEDPTSATVVPYGVEGSLTRYNNLHGIYSTGNIYIVRAGGAIGDVRTLTGNIGYVQANTNGIEDGVGTNETPRFESNIMELPSAIYFGGISHFHHSFSPFGKGQNTVGDGIFGRVFSGTGQDFQDAQGNGVNGGGYIWKVAGGQGTEGTVLDTTNAYPHPPDSLSSPFTSASGIFVGSGVYTGYFIMDVRVNGEGNEIGGDVMAQTNDPITGYAVNVHATGGAVIESHEHWWDFNVRDEFNVPRTDKIFNGWVSATTVDAAFDEWASTANVGIVSGSGAGTSILNTNIAGAGIHAVTVTGATAAGGISWCRLISSTGGLGLLSSDGMGIAGTTVFANGLIGTIRTTGEDSKITGADILAVSGVLSLETPAIENSYLDIYTLGRLSRLDFMRNTTFLAGGLRQIYVNDDVTKSTVTVQGPLDLLNVGGNIVDSEISALGFYGQIGTIKAGGGIISSTALTQIYSVGSIKNITAGIGGIDADITALGATGSATVTAAGNVSGEWYFHHYVSSIKTKTGDIAASITVETDPAVTTKSIGTISCGGDITGDINAMGSVGSITAAGSIGTSGTVTDFITIGGKLGTLASKGGSILCNVVVGGGISSVKAAGDIGEEVDDVAVVLTAGGTVGTISAGASKLIGHIYSDITVTESLKTISATGNIAGDVVVGTDSERDYLGTMTAAGAISGDVDVTGDAKSIKAGESVGGAATLFSIGRDLKSLVVGSSSSSSPVLCDVEVGRDLGKISVSGAFDGGISVTGRAKSITIGGDAGQLGDVITIGGSLGSLKVGTTTQISDLFASVVVGADVEGDLGTYFVRGKVYSDLTVNGDVGKITMGPLEPPVGEERAFTITGDLGSIVTQSQMIEAHGVPPIDYYFYNGPEIAGTLTVLGEIKTPVR